MSTLEVACGNCDQRFRVRAEFAGKSTRCPGCSAPLTVGGSKPAPSPPDPAERPRPRPRPRDDDDRPAPPSGDWRPVDSALGREQVAVLFALVTIVCSFLSFCLLRLGEGPGGTGGVFLTLGLLLLVGPSLVSGTFGIIARVTALGVPAEARARGAAIASLLCAIAGVVSLVVFGFSILMGMEHQAPEPLAAAVAGLGFVFSTLAAAGTFAVFVAQVGIARRSAALGQAFGRAAVAVACCLLSVLGICFLIALGSELTGPTYSGPGGYGRSHQTQEVLAMITFGFLVPVALAIVLITYHRVLAAARLAVRGEVGGRE